MKKVLSIFLFLLVLLPVSAQQMTHQAPTSVYEGDNFTVRFVVDARASGFQGPSFKGFSLRSGPNSSSSSNFSFVNGQMTSSVQTIFSYTLTADLVGTFTVDPASCIVDGKKISSQSFTIKVEKGDPNRRQQQQQQQRQAYDPWAQQPRQASEIDSKSLFARASVSKNNPYQGEQIIVTYKIYTQVPLSQYAIDKLPGNRGFWAEDLSEGSKIKQYEETVGDRRYQVAEIRRGALFAQESGKLTIEPLDLNVLAMVQRQRQRTGTIWDLFDDPFFSAREAVERPLSTNRIAVNVRPLPAAPEGFSGAVGRFDVQGGLSLDKVKANEAVSYRLTVSGSGNLMLINAPSPEFPNVFEVYDPQIDDNIKKGENGVSGSRTFEWVLIPRTQGKYTIPACKFIFFDPTTGQYVTKTVEQQEIEVEKGDARNVAHTGSKDDVRLLNSDINYLHPTGHLQVLRHEDHAGITFWLAAILIVLLTAGVLIFSKRHREAEQDVVGMRMKRATRMARKRLKRAEAHLKDGQTNLFYEEIYRAIWGCLSYKYNIPLSTLSRESVTQCLIDKQVPANQQEQIMKVLQDVDLARFAPGDAHVQMQSVYDEALNMIVAL
ncbi:MAG: BatD family protein [Bacteroidales bacterium]|nr:BatD family protein [Bacteroidales bacterium]